MSDPKDRVFVDTGAWIALALTQDPLHDRARAAWQRLRSAGRRILTSLPIVIETFTFLDRNTTRDVALQWKDLLPKIPHFKVLECTSRDMAEAWAFLSRPNLHKLSLVDATSFVLMARERVRMAFAYDHHFASVGFRLLD